MAVVFTIITGNYDNLKPIQVKNPDWRYIAIVDNLDIDPNGWELLHISALNPPEGLNNLYLQRWAKIIGAIEYFKCHTIYVDGKLSIEMDVTFLASKDEFSIMKHPIRSCVYDEAHACNRLKKAESGMIEQQMSAYRKLGIPKYFGMFDTSLMIRKYTPEVVEFGRKWWSELLEFTHRDQLSVTKVQWEMDMGIFPIPSKLVYQFVTIHKHKVIDGKPVFHTHIPA